MNDSPATIKIGLLGNIGNGNLGDEATFAAVIQNIRRYCPSAEVYGFSENPRDTRERHHIPVFPMRRKRKESLLPGVTDGKGLEVDGRTKGFNTLFEQIKGKLKAIPLIYKPLKVIQRSLISSVCLFGEIGYFLKCLKIVKGTDLLIVPGSGHLSDHFGGPWNYPYTLVKWGVIAKVSGAKLAFLSVGAGPLTSPLSRLFIKKSLSFASYRSFRDHDSKKVAEQIGVRGEKAMFPDLAYSLHINGSPHRIFKKKSRPLVGINPFPYFDDRYWPISNPSAYSNYLDRLSSFASWLLESGYKILLFATQVRADPLVIKDIKGILKENKDLDLDEQLCEPSIQTIDDLISQISMTDFVVATRFHAILISFLLNKPVLGIANHPKMVNLMRDMGQSEYVLDIGRFDLKSLVERFSSLESNREIIRERIGKQIADFRIELDVQYNQVLDGLTQNGMTFAREASIFHEGSS